MKNAYRHGELLFVEVQEVPQEAKAVRRKNIIKGSHGNAHSITSGVLYDYAGDDFVIGYLKTNNTKLLHKEHGSGEGTLKEAELPNGIYEIRKQVEFINEEMKQVID
jgi:hypothetical protein